MRETGAASPKSSEMADLNSQEIALMTIIAMNKGTIPEIKLKRIYLERYSFWELQHIEDRLVDKGLLEKSLLNDGKDFEYAIPAEHFSALRQSSTPKELTPLRDEHINPSSSVCCADYSVLWYLWKLDSATGGLIFPEKSRRDSMVAERTLEEYLGVDRMGLRFLKQITSSLSTSAFWIYDGHSKWSSVLDSPHKLVREIFGLARDILRAGGELGPDDVGFDNIDLLFDELGRLSPGEWYGFRELVVHARNKLFSANQPFRWIHFEEERVMELIFQKIKMLGIIETAINRHGEQAVRLTPIGGFCLGKVSARRFLTESSARGGQLIVHPNFEVTFVSREMNPSVLIELSMFTEPVNLDTATVLRITKGSVLEGMELGLKIEDMISLLNENSRGVIPQNVEYSISDWGA